MMANDLPVNTYPPTTNVKLVHLPYSWIMWVQLFAIGLGMFGSLFYALLNHYDDVTKTLCHARDPVNWFPSFSSVIGNGFPELLIWRIGMLLLLPFRFWESLLYYWIFTKKQQHMQKKIIPHYLGFASNALESHQPLALRINNNCQDLDDINNTLKRSNNSNLSLNSSIQTNLSSNNIEMDDLHAKNNSRCHTKDISFNKSINISFQPVPTSQKVLSFLHSFTMVIEYIGLTLLSFVSSKEKFIIHEYGFVLYLIFSHLHVLLNFYLTRMTWSLSGPVFKFQCVKLTLYLMNITALYGVFYFYTRHNDLCEDGIYSLFGLSEYTLVITNTTNHVIKSLQYTWEGRFSFFLHLPTLPLTHSDSNVVSSNYDVMYNKYYDQEGYFIDKYNDIGSLDELLLTQKEKLGSNLKKTRKSSQFSRINNINTYIDDDSSSCEDYELQYSPKSNGFEGQQIIGLSEHSNTKSVRSYSSSNVDMDNLNDLDIL